MYSGCDKPLNLSFRKGLYLWEKELPVVLHCFSWSFQAHFPVHVLGETHTHLHHQAAANKVSLPKHPFSFPKQLLRRVQEQRLENTIRSNHVSPCSFFSFLKQNKFSRWAQTSKQCCYQRKIQSWVLWLIPMQKPSPQQLHTFTTWMSKTLFTCSRLFSCVEEALVITQ